MALQSMLGLICDPVAGRVEAPCLGKNVIAASNACLLYTSDAADERSSVDLGGRRIIKKKNSEGAEGRTNIER